MSFPSESTSVEAGCLPAPSTARNHSPKLIAMSSVRRIPGERHGVSVLGWVVAILAGVFLALWVGSALGAGDAGERIGWIGLAVGCGVGLGALALGIVLIRVWRPEQP